jgi:hypothetical protein
VERQADAAKVSTTLWIHELKNRKTTAYTRSSVTAGREFGLLPRLDAPPELIRWPHVNINTLRKEPQSAWHERDLGGPQRPRPHLRDANTSCGWRRTRTLWVVTQDTAIRVGTVWHSGATLTCKIQCRLLTAWGLLSLGTGGHGRISARACHSSVVTSINQ